MNWAFFRLICPKPARLNDPEPSSQGRKAIEDVF